MAGWGRSTVNRWSLGSQFDTGASTNILQQLKVPLLDHNDCNAEFKEEISEERQFCAGGDPGTLRIKAHVGIVAGFYL